MLFNRMAFIDILISSLGHASCSSSSSPPYDRHFLGFAHQMAVPCRSLIQGSTDNFSPLSRCRALGSSSNSLSIPFHSRFGLEQGHRRRFSLRAARSGANDSVDRSSAELGAEDNTADEENQEVYVQRKATVNCPGLDAEGRLQGGVADMIRQAMREVEQYKMGVAQLQVLFPGAVPRCCHS